MTSLKASAIAAMSALAFASVALAQPQSRDLPYDNTLGVTVSMDNEGGPAADPAGRLSQAITDLEGTLGPAASGPAPKVDTSTGKTIGVVARQFANDAGNVHMLVATDAGGGICHIRAPANPEVQNQIPQLLMLCISQFGKGQTLPGAAPSQPPAQPAAAKAVPATGRYAQNWAQVDSVWFRSTAGIGAGGGVTVEYEPLILLKDGTYYEVDSAPLEDIDLAAERRTKPKRWGKWSKSGASYVLTGASGKPNSYDPATSQFFKAYPGEAAPLKPAYERLGGGGNTAMGGDMMIAIQDRYDFMPGGRFTTGTDVGATNSGASTGVGSTTTSSRRMAQPGSYTLKSHALTLTFPDGRQERRFFAYGSRRNPTQVSPGMIFIGDSVYTDAD